MKRWIGMILALAMTAALAAPALAEEEQTQPEIDTGMMDLDDTVCFLAPESGSKGSALQLTLAQTAAMFLGRQLEG